MKTLIYISSGILNARHYNRGIKAHKQMVEALWRLYWVEFVKWTKSEDYEWRLDPLNNALDEFYAEFDLGQADKSRIPGKLKVSESSKIPPIRKKIRGFSTRIEGGRGGG